MTIVLFATYSKVEAFIATGTVIVLSAADNSTIREWELAWWKITENEVTIEFQLNK